MNLRRWLVAIAVVVVTVLGATRTVSAHASLISTNPAADSVLDAAPTVIVLTFTEPVDPTDDAIRVVDAQGEVVAVGPVGQDLGNDSITAAIDQELADGSYVVAWSVVSSDSHPIRGAFVFSVGQATDIDDDLITDADQGEEVSSPVWLTVGRFASYAGIAVLIGTLAAAVAFAPSTLRTRRLAATLFAGGYLAMAGTVAMIAAQANVIGSSPLDWTAVLNTRSGGWWLIRLIIVAVITGLVPWRALLAHRSARAVAVVSAIGLFAVVAAGGHAVSGRWIGLGFAITVIHLAAMATWIGGLCLLATVVERDALLTTAARFSPVALGSVAVLAATGTISGWRQLGRVDAIIDTSYGRWLLIKLALVAIVLAIAATARRILKQTPSTAIDDPDPGGGEIEHVGDADRFSSLRRNLFIEASAMVLVVAATAGLTGATPPRAVESTAVDASVTVAQDDYIAQIDLLPATTGGTVMHVTITPPGGSLTTADEITVTAALPAAQVGPIEILTFPAGPNHVTTNEANFPLPGQWTITVTARYGEFDQVVFTTDVAVSNP
jgi:copper transport protein